MRTRIKGAWDWFTGLRWWWKTLLVAPVAIAAFVGLYVFARGVQYSSVTGSAAAYLPASADLSLGVFDLEGEWARLQDSSFWKKIDKKVLKDRTTRALLNERLKEADLPTVDQWKDDRWLADNPFFTEEMILRGAGRDVMAALRVGASFQKARMVAATKVTFGDYLLLPFAGLAGSFIGAGSESIGNWSALKIVQGNATWYVVIDGAYVIVSDDRDLLREGMKKKGKRPKGTDPFWLKADFDRSAELAKWRKGFSGFPVGAGLSFLDVNMARGMEVAARVTGSSVLVDLRLDGAVALNTRSGSEYAAFAPADASGYVTQSAGMQEIYDWIRGLLRVDPKATPFEKMIRKQASEIVTEFTNAGFEERFLPYAEAPSVLVLGVEVGSENRTYTAGALLFSSPDPLGAIEGFRDTFKALSPQYATFTEEDVGGVRLIYFERDGDVMGVNDYLRPCMMALDGVAVIANNLQFARRIIDVAAFGEERFVDQRVMTRARRVMKKAKFAPPGSRDLGGGFISLSRIREGLHGHLPEIAAQTIPADTILRKEVEAELVKRGEKKTVLEVDDLVGAERKSRIAKGVRESERSLRPMRYVDWIAYGVREEARGLRFRLMITLK